MSSENSGASLIGGHAKYVQGAVSSALGYESGEQTKKDAVSEMKQASAESSDGRPAQNSTLGLVENKLGQVTGCEGMEKEGAQRIPQGSEAENGTG